MVKHLNHLLLKMLSYIGWGSPHVLPILVNILKVWLEKTYMESWVDLHPLRQLESVGHIAHPFDHVKRLVIPLHQTFVKPFVRHLLPNLRCEFQ